MTFKLIVTYYQCTWIVIQSIAFETSVEWKTICNVFQGQTALFSYTVSHGLAVVGKTLLAVPWSCRRAVLQVSKTTYFIVVTRRDKCEICVIWIWNHRHQMQDFHNTTFCMQSCRVWICFKRENEVEHHQTEFNTYLYHLEFKF